MEVLLLIAAQYNVPHVVDDKLRFRQDLYYDFLEYPILGHILYLKYAEISTSVIEHAIKYKTFVPRKVIWTYNQTALDLVIRHKRPHGFDLAQLLIQLGDEFSNPQASLDELMNKENPDSRLVRLLLDNGKTQAYSWHLTALVVNNKENVQPDLLKNICMLIEAGAEPSAECVKLVHEYQRNDLVNDITYLPYLTKISEHEPQEVVNEMAYSFLVKYKLFL